jgi:hypothetical protein
MAKLLIDTNVLLLLIVGRWDRSRISQFRRTAQFSTTDFDTLQSHIRLYSEVVTTPAVLTEVSNLMGNSFHETIAQTIVNVCDAFAERAPGKGEVFGDEGFDRLGFADASILCAVADDEQTVVLTDDAGLYNEVLYRGAEAINFNHLRSRP